MTPDSNDTANRKVRALLAGVLQRPVSELEALPGNTPLFAEGLSLDSITGLELLLAIKQVFGVDIAAEDLNLDSLETLDTLANYLAGHSDSSHTGR